ncbi:antibiotic biosynthesis monooxygenase [Methylocapsa sp. S129]|uniref:antibiotic biosynthesis monooxygenase n=1 Tax=Methylocapsa sp. S129 TaxID=1641869 RepID=UPI00131AF71C|nr:antibiotic biosynthesis monooxygenase [Methylocapsa sp. S129]
MIARTWCGTASAEKADDYQRHFTSRVAPHLKELAGHKGAYLLRRQDKGEVEFLAVTLWDSIESIRAFAGPNLDVANVEPEGRAALSRFDDFARHYDVAYNGV